MDLKLNIMENYGASKAKTLPSEEEMKSHIIRKINDLLEVDHDTIVSILCTEQRVPIESDLREKTPLMAISALDVINLIFEGEDITPEFENGILQRLTFSAE